MAAVVFARRTRRELDAAEAILPPTRRSLRLLLARGVTVSEAVLSPADRAESEHSDWTPHDSREILELLGAAARK